MLGCLEPALDHAFDVDAVCRSFNWLPLPRISCTSTFLTQDVLNSNTFESSGSGTGCCGLPGWMEDLHLNNEQLCCTCQQPAPKHMQTPEEENR
ncbi:unnamed protein product [Protopolystoma xenopodis]|uniref:Uncharacterized protein n=1 Tax=Protopolystoma xenopodis TaxID=117903 RepID=A0A448X7W3_9PLAT|nr:unnamed protein product [Protopolystoma xenopodis]